MTNLENIIHKGLTTDNWFVDGTGADAVNIVIALRDTDAQAYKYNPNWLLEEYKEQIQLKQWEYDLLMQLYDFDKFEKYALLRGLKEKGHFQGVKNTLLEIAEILKNSVIIAGDASDYTDFDECK